MSLRNWKGFSRHLRRIDAICPVHFIHWFSKSLKTCLGKVSFALDVTERTEPNETITTQPSRQQFKQPLCGCSLGQCCLALWCGFTIVDDVAVYLDKKSSCISPFYCLFCCFIVSLKSTNHGFVWLSVITSTGKFSPFSSVTNVEHCVRSWILVARGVTIV